MEAIYEALHIEPRFERERASRSCTRARRPAQAGAVGELHPAVLEGAWGAFELDLETLVADAPDGSSTRT